MKTFLLVIIKNLVSMIITKNMILWSLEKLAGYTDNKIDDNVITIVSAAYDSDTPKLKNGVEGLFKVLKDE